MALFNTLFGARRARGRPSLPSDADWHAATVLRAPTALIQLSEQDALTVVGYMEMRHCAEGEAIIRQGDSGGSGDDGFMALVVEGEVTVEALQVSRLDAQTINVLGPGHLMGEMSLMDGAARSATCTASTAVRCAVLSREALEALIADEPATAARLLSAVALRLSRRLRETDSKLQLYSQLVASLQQEINRLVPDLD